MTTAYIIPPGTDAIEAAEFIGPDGSEILYAYPPPGGGFFIDDGFLLTFASTAPFWTAFKGQYET